MEKYIKVNELSVSEFLYNFIEKKLLPDLGITSEKYWQDFATLFNELVPENKELLKKREEFQNIINQWHLDNPSYNFDEYKSFLKTIDYLQDEPQPFEVETKNVDDEIAEIAGAQLVVPLKNARFALNATNARWGSLYDAMYGTDYINQDGDTDITKEYNIVRGDTVIKKSNEFLDKTVPVSNGTYANIKQYNIVNHKLQLIDFNGNEVNLKNSDNYVGYTDNEIVLNHNRLHIRLVLNDDNSLKDIIMESAISVIMDAEDSVTAVDGEDKTEIYTNWLGLMRCDLNESFEKNGKTITRVLNEDFFYTDVDGNKKSINGCALMLIRNVGHLMTNPAILDKNGNELPEGIMDALITTTCAVYDLKSKNNSKKGSIYIVKPKMHGEDEVAFSDKLFSHVEKILGLEKNTIKIGIMDEERRTSLNLLRCIEKAKHRVIFINTGFLDRTGDEIHTSMNMGAMIKKDDMKSSKWLSAYEYSNVYSGLKAGMKGIGQIGKGMWAKPDKMADMVVEKIAHVKSGATTAWVPSPTAATLHSMHYHAVNVNSLQQEMLNNLTPNSIDDILSIPVLYNQEYSKDEIENELNNNVQGILGYVVRWVELGIGCSKVPDINNIGLMEDRATLRISSQHIANWLHHSICSKEQVLAALKKMAVIVDKQNTGTSGYENMSDDFDNNIAFKSACDLIFDGVNQPNGYTEPVLHKARTEFKKAH